MLYLDKISGERLQDHLSSGSEDLTKIIFQSSSNKHLISSSDGCVVTFVNFSKCWSLFRMFIDLFVIHKICYELFYMFKMSIICNIVI